MTKKEFDLNKYIQSSQKVTPSVDYKEEEFVKLEGPFQKALGIPGFALGHMNMIYGFSDSGKTSLLLSAVKSCQTQDILPILIVTETKLTRDRIVASGVDLNKIILIDDLTCLEEVYDFISVKCQEVIDGKLPTKVMIFWDSAAGAPSRDSFTINKDGTIDKHFDNRKNANVIGFYSPVIANRVAKTRQKEFEGTIGVTMVTQAYVGEKPKFPIGAPAPIIANGGEKVWFSMSTAVEVQEGRRIKTLIKGTNINCGLVSKLRLAKNHLSAISHEGSVVFMEQEVFEDDKKVIDSYIGKRKEEWEKSL